MLVQSQRGWYMTCGCSSSPSAAQQLKFPKLICFDIVTTHNDHPNYRPPPPLDQAVRGGCHGQKLHSGLDSWQEAGWGCGVCGGGGGGLAQGFGIWLFVVFVCLWWGGGVHQI